MPGAGVPGRRVTSIDVAKRAGVSQPTVSRALRDLRGTSEATRRRVRDAARELGYVPHQSGRSLVTRRSRRIGIVVGELGNPFYPALIDPTVHTLQECGYLAVIVHDDDAHGVDAEPIFDGSFDGVILTAEREGSALPDEMERRGVPFVMMNREVQSDRGDVRAAQVPDNGGGAAAVAELLVGLGHRRIAMMTGPRQTSTSRERRAAFVHTLERHGRPVESELLAETEFTVDGGVAALDRLMAMSPRPTAVFCANDVLALGVLEGARAHGLMVPDELTVVGFDDITIAGSPLVDLTTVAVDHHALAVESVRALVRRIEGAEKTARRRVHPVRLVLRGTHAACATPNAASRSSDPSKA